MENDEIITFSYSIILIMLIRLYYGTIIQNSIPFANYMFFSDLPLNLRFGKGVFELFTVKYHFKIPKIRQTVVGRI